MARGHDVLPANSRIPRHGISYVKSHMLHGIKCIPQLPSPAATCIGDSLDAAASTITHIVQLGLGTH
jgi:hypothetical protein